MDASLIVIDQKCKWNVSEGLPLNFRQISGIDFMPPKNNVE